MKKRDSNQTKANILEAAEYEFSEKGIYGTRVDEIANRAQINKRMIYEYFGNKEELYRAVFMNVYQRLGDMEINILSIKDSCVDSIRHVIRFYFDYLNENPSYINLLLWENLNKGKYIQDLSFSNTRNSGFNILREIINQGKYEGVFRRELETDQVLVSILMFTFSCFSNRYTMSKLFDTDFTSEESMNKRIENITDMVISYMCVNN